MYLARHAKDTYTEGLGNPLIVKCGLFGNILPNDTGIFVRDSTQLTGRGILIWKGERVMLI